VRGILFLKKKKGSEGYLCLKIKFKRQNTLLIFFKEMVLG